MSIVKTAPVKQTVSHRAWLRAQVQPYHLAAGAIIFSLVIAVVGMPDLIAAHTRVYSPLVLCLVLIFWAGIAMFRQRRLHLKLAVLDYALLATFAYFTLRNLNVHTATNTICGIGLFYLASELVRRRKFIRIIFATFTYLAATAAVFGLFELIIFRNNLASDWGIADTDPRQVFPRIGSTLLHPVVFGAFLAMALPVCGYIGFTAGSRRIRIIGMVSVILCLLSTLFTFAKGGWLITFFMGAVFVFLLFRDHDVKKLAFMAGMTVVILLPLFFLWQPVSEQTMLRIKSSVRSRTYTWKYAWRGIAQNPLFGVGQAQGPIALVDMSALLEKYYHDHSTPAAIDNYYLEYLLEEGAAGFLPFLLFLVLLFYRGARGLFRPAHSGMLIPVFAGLAALCLDAVTFDALTWWSLFICFWVFAGLLNGLAAEGRAEGETETVKGIAAAGTEL